jgi:MFS family permease
MKNSFVIGCDIIVKILVAPFFGYLADKLGRRNVNLYGIVIIAISMSAMPFCMEYYQYVLVRIFYAHGK